MNSPRARRISLFLLTPPSLLRTLAGLVALAVLSMTGTASAQLPCIPGFCPQTVVAPQRPPPHTPQVEQATRARYEAEARVKLEAEARQAAESEVHEQRRRAWVERGVVPPPPAFPIKLPMVEVFVGARQLDPHLRDRAVANSARASGLLSDAF